MRISVTRYDGQHKGGTKEYSLYLMYSSVTQKALLVKRWGPVGATGQIKIELTHGDGDKEFRAALKERQSKGYDMRVGPSNNFSDLSSAISTTFQGHHARQFYANHLKHLDPSVDGGGANGSFEPLAESREKLMEKMRREAEAKAAAERAEIAAREEQEMKSNPLFGMF